MQSRLSSLIESKANILVGLPVNYLLNFYMIGILSEPLANKEHWAFVTMTVVFTLVSIIRSYCIRRFFNSKLKRTI